VGEVREVNDSKHIILGRKYDMDNEHFLGKHEYNLVVSVVLCVI
jgi:hypothetical protein